MITYLLQSDSYSCMDSGLVSGLVCFLRHYETHP